MPTVMTWKNFPAIDRLGYSPLGYFKRPEYCPIIKAIMSMAHSPGFKTIAEGEETTEQAQILRLLRCDLIQGFY